MRIYSKFFVHIIRSLVIWKKKIKRAGSNGQDKGNENRKRKRKKRGDSVGKIRE